MKSRPTYINEKGQINESEFCEEFIKSNPMIFKDGCFYGVDGVWDNDKIKYLISREVSPYLKTNIASKIKNVFEALKFNCQSDDIIVSQNKIHLNNGTLNVDGSFTADKKICANRINIDYDQTVRDGPHNPCNFLNFLSELIDEEDIPLLQEYLGYCLIPSTKAQKMLIIVGNGGEGKSRLGIILNEILGNFSFNGSLHKIESNKYFCANLQNKLLMIDDDMRMSSLRSTDYIKKIITAESPIDVEPKHVQSHQVMLYSRFLCFANGSPKALYDKSDGFIRRIYILNTKPVSEGRVDDPFIADKFIAEKDEIFWWMFDGLQRLIKNNFTFTLSEGIKKNIEDLRIDNCNISEFFKDASYVKFGINCCCSTRRIYSAYLDWCELNCFTPVNMNIFSGYLKSNAGKLNIIATTHIPAENNKEVRGYKGISVCYA